MEPVTTAVGNLTNSKTMTTVAKHLWPTMLFLVVMSILMLIGTILMINDDPLNKLIAYWIWFSVNTIITGFGVHAFLLDTRIHVAMEVKAKQQSGDT